MYYEVQFLRGKMAPPDNIGSLHFRRVDAKADANIYLVEGLSRPSHEYEAPKNDTYQLFVPYL